MLFRATLNSALRGSHKKRINGTKSTIVVSYLIQANFIELINQKNGEGAGAAR